MKTVNPAKTCVRKFYVHEQILLARNSRCKFIKNLLPEKPKENKPNNRDLNRD